MRGERSDLFFFVEPKLGNDSRRLSRDSCHGSGRYDLASALRTRRDGQRRRLNGRRALTRMIPIGAASKGTLGGRAARRGGRIWHRRRGILRPPRRGGGRRQRRLTKVLMLGEVVELQRRQADRLVRRRRRHEDVGREGGRRWNVRDGRAERVMDVAAREDSRLGSATTTGVESADGSRGRRARAFGKDDETMRP